jgi:hypothetical protein
MLIIDASPQLWAPTPTDIGSGLYLNARQRITIASDAVSGWGDRDGKWTFTQPNSSLRFLYSATGWNGTPAINVTAASQRLVGTAPFTPLIGVSGFTTFALARHTATGWIWQHGNSTPSARTGFVIIDNTLYGVINNQVTTGAIPAATNNLLVWRFNGSAATKSTLRLNGANLASGGITATATTANAGALIIGFSVDPHTFLGFMSDLLILPYAASDALIQKFEGCLAWQSGQRLPSFNALHPFFSRPPLTSDP